MKKLSFLFFLLLLPLLASAAVEINGIYYNLNSNTQTAEVTRGSTKYTGSITIPKSVTYLDVSYNVTSIGEHAFAGRSSLTSVTTPNSVTSIGSYAFEDCSSLTDMYCNAINVPNAYSIYFG